MCNGNRIFLCLIFGSRLWKNWVEVLWERDRMSCWCVKFKKIVSATIVKISELCIGLFGSWLQVILTIFVCVKLSIVVNRYTNIWVLSNFFARGACKWYRPRNGKAQDLWAVLIEQQGMLEYAEMLYGRTEWLEEKNWWENPILEINNSRSVATGVLVCGLSG